MELDQITFASTLEVDDGSAILTWIASGHPPVLQSRIAYDIHGIELTSISQIHLDNDCFTRQIKFYCLGRWVYVLIKILKCQRKHRLHVTHSPLSSLELFSFTVEVFLETPSRVPRELPRELPRDRVTSWVTSRSSYLLSYLVSYLRSTIELPRDDVV